MKANHVVHERIQLYLPRDMVAWLAMQPQGRNAAAKDVFGNWIVDAEYETVKARYCKGLSDLEILRLERSEIAEMAEDDDIDLVWRVLQGGSKKAFEAHSSPYVHVEEGEFTPENALALFEAYLNGGDELGYVAEKDVIAAIKFLRAKLLAK